MPTPARSDFTRPWLLENRAGPAADPTFLRGARAGQLAWNQGTITPVYEPDPDQYGNFVIVTKLPGTPDSPEIPLNLRYDVATIATLMRLVRTNCDSDLQVAVGLCGNPQDFNRGWQKKIILEAARIGNYGTSGDIGAMQPGDRSMVEEQATFQGEDMYEVTQLTFAEILASTVTKPVVDVVVCDLPSCGGDCGVASDGCQDVFFISTATAGSPGAPPYVVVSSDAGATGTARTITPFSAVEDPDEGTCVGENLVIISQDAGSLVYADKDDLILGTHTWTEVTTGFVTPTGSPRTIYAAGPNDVFIGGAGGYIYYANDITSGVTVQSAGTVTTQDLNASHGIDDQHVVMVGASNAVVVTHDGGTTWASKTGPAVGVSLTAVWMVTKDIYWIGTAGGRLYYTLNDGQTWTEKGFTGNGAGTVQDIVFATRSVGFMSHSTATPAGRIFRTTDGGASWYLLPEASTASSIPANDHIYSLAPCNQNTVYGGGLADNAVDGFAVKAS